jgi:hypothetical protein
MEEDLMGRGNVRICGEYEGLYYLDRDRIENIENMEVGSDWAWNDMEEFICERLEKRFPSFWRVDEWDDDRHILLENKLFRVAVCDNDWSAAWMLLEGDEIEDAGRNLMKRHYRRYLEGIKNALIDEYGEAVGYVNVWTSGLRYTEKAC